MGDSPPPRILRYLKGLGLGSPCAKSQRGVIIYDQGTGIRRGSGWNAPPKPFICDGSEACRESCSKICIHAEQAAIADAISGFTHFAGLFGHALVHGKFVNGELVAGGGPSCWECSKAILYSGIEHVWLYELNGSEPPVWVKYPAIEFHRITLAACGLHAGPGPGP